VDLGPTQSEDPGLTRNEAPALIQNEYLGPTPDKARLPTAHPRAKVPDDLT
jgi:hypothetical protein